MKKLTWILGLLLLGMSLITGRASAVTEMPPVVEVAPAGQDRPQVDARRSAVWYRQMHQAVPAGRKSVAKAGEVAKPVFYIDGEAITEATKEVAAGTEVTIFCTTDGATITYTTNGNEPDDWATEYTGAISVKKAMTLKAVAYVYGTGDDYSTYYSEIATIDFTVTGGEEDVTVAKPVFKIGEEEVTGSKTVVSGTKVSISCATSGATIKYTTDKSDPSDMTGEDYPSDGITIDKAMTLKAVAYVEDDDWNVTLSDVATVDFTITGGGEDPGTEPIEPTVATPVFTIGDEVVTGAREVEAGTLVSISCATAGTSIYYTTDGTTPSDLSGTEYEGSVAINTDMTLKAIAYTSDFKASDEAQVSFTIKDGTGGGDEPGDDEEEPGRDLFVCTFESADDFAAKWTVTDQDGDKKTWRYVTGMDTYYPAFDGSYDNGYAKSASREDETKVADYMMTKSAITMPAGKAYTTFKYALGSYNPVHLKVYCSKTPELEASGMTLIGELYDAKHVEDAWKDTVMVFTLAEAGNYYFWFMHCSEPDEFGMNVEGLYMDDIIIGTGRYNPTPDLQIEHVILPYSSCVLGTAETIGVRLKNIGTAPMTKVSLSYKINDGAVVTEDFDVLLALSADTILKFTQKADFSAEDKTYTVIVSGTVEGETLTTNNEGTGRVTHFVPVETLPFIINTENEEGQHQLGYDSEAWTYEEEEGFGNWFADTLVTRCIAMTGGNTYRFAFERQSGVDLGVAQLPESFWVVYGLSGTPMKDWQILKFYEADYTFGTLKRDEILLTPASSGNYSFAIVSDERCCNASLFISRMEVEAVGEHDVVIADMMTSLARRTPAFHAVAPMFDVMVVNRGLNDENVKVVVKHGDKEIGSSDLTIKKADTGYCKIQGKLAQPVPGEEISLRFEANLTDTDATPENNTMDWTFTATDSLYAFDKDTTYGRAMTSKYVIGEIFTLAKPDTLTALMLGWYPLEESIAFGVEIYPVEEIEKMDYYEAGKCLFSHEFKRQAEGGMETVPMGVVLPEGRYLIALKRLDPSLLHVGFDEQPEGKFYMLHQGIVYPNVEFGYLALRAVFGKAGVVTGNGMEMALSQVKSYPNPVSGLWTVTAYGLEIDRVEIFNTMGSVVYRSADKLSSETWSLNMDGFMPGLYVARVYTNAGIQTLKVMVR